ncbi:hypothetical protein OIU79_012029 [Salix purpurea]|uniref:U1-type domain-containing protein n=1 Tax=Salix purpurea TaxID=77065 RepID=A0A9Q0Q278_SALPP|nr:hypothetical protein OIU79_012029 [Salix purpurea]
MVACSILGSLEFIKEVSVFSSRLNFVWLCALILLHPAAIYVSVNWMLHGGEAEKKPDPNLCGAKRKFVTPSTSVGELPFAGIKKKPKEEWSCALCQVSATSERGLSEHLQGRRHKAKEAELRAQKMPKNPNKASIPIKKTAKAAKLAILTTGLEMEAEIEDESLQHNKSDNISNKKFENKEQGGDKNDAQLVQKNHQLESLNKSMAESVQRKERTPEIKMKKKFKFWCEMCQIGAYSEMVMEGHNKGKKHLAWLQKCSRNSEAVQADKKAKDLELGAEGEKDSEVVVEETEDSDNSGLESLNKSMAESVQRKERTPEIKMKRKFKFWCEMCQIGAYSEMVMEGHNKGKKHLARLQKCSQNSEAVQADKKAKDLELGAEGAKDSEVVVEETEDSDNSGLVAWGANTERTEIVIANEKTETVAANTADESRPPTITIEKEGVH